MLYEKKIKINNMINKIKDKDILKKIFLLVHKEFNNDATHNDKYTHNNNGIYFDLNNLKEETLLQIEAILLDSLLDNNTDSDTLKLNIYTIDETNDYLKISNGFKLSNKEKILINNNQVNHA